MILRGKDRLREEILIKCSCIGQSIDHSLIFSMYNDEACDELYCHVALTPRRFFGRIILGLKYIFGFKCEYGHYNEWILDKEDAQELSDLFGLYAKRLEKSTSKSNRVNTYSKKY